MARGKGRAYPQGSVRSLPLGPELVAEGQRARPPKATPPFGLHFFLNSPASSLVYPPQVDALGASLENSNIISNAASLEFRNTP